MGLTWRSDTGREAAGLAERPTPDAVRRAGFRSELRPWCVVNFVLTTVLRYCLFDAQLVPMMMVFLGTELLALLVCFNTKFVLIMIIMFANVLRTLL